MVIHIMNLISGTHLHLRGESTILLYFESTKLLISYPLINIDINAKFSKLMKSISFSLHMSVKYGTNLRIY